MTYRVFLMYVISFAFLFATTSVFAANICQVQVFATSGSTSVKTVNKGTSKNYNIPFKKAYVMATGNNVILEVEAATYQAYPVKSNRTLKLPAEARLKKIVCLNAKSSGSGTVELSDLQKTKLYSKKVREKLEKIEQRETEGVKSIQLK